MRLQTFIHHYPSAWRLPTWILVFLLRLPRRLVPIEWTTWGGSASCPFSKTFVWPKETPEERPLYVRCPACATEWLWKGGQYECGSCKFAAAELVIRRAQLLKGHVYLGVFTAWCGEDRKGAWLARPWNAYPPEIQQIIIDKVFMPIVREVGA